MKAFSVTLLTLLNVYFGMGENVLFFIGGICSHSHRYGMEPIAFKLVEKGHNVTFFSTLRPSKPNSKIINYAPPEVKEASTAFHEKFGVYGLQERIKQKQNMDMGNDPDEIFDMSLAMNKLTMESPDFRRWLNETKFDLVVVDKSTLSDIAYVIAYLHGAKLISYTGIATVIPWDFYLYGVPTDASWIPQFDVFFDGKDMDFLARLRNEYSLFRWRWGHQSYLEKQTKQFREGFGRPDMPHMRELMTSESIVFTNLHYSDSYAKSLPPFMKAVGGMHLEESNVTLPKEIDEFIRGAGDEGFIYISFGSIVTISTMPEWLLKVFFTALRGSKMRFLWKWEGEKPKDVPDNVFLMKWFPQNDVLAHPKIRGFVTQGGQVSMQQAIFHGVPVIIFPVNGDQDANAKRVDRYGNGIVMEFHGLTAEALASSFKEITGNPKYKEVATRLSIASKNRPMSAIDEAMWWTEFVLKHNKEQLQILKPLSIGQPWWVVQMLDVWAFVASAALIFLIAFTAGIWVLLRLVSNLLMQKPQKVSEKKRK